MNLDTASRNSSKTTHMSALLLSVALICIALPASGTEIYRWQDKQGNPVISDRRPAPGTPYTTLNPTRLGISPNKKTTASNPQNAWQTRTDRPESRISGTTQGTEKPVESTQAFCITIDNSISKLTTRPRISVRESDGSTRFLSDVERQGKLAEALALRDANCR